jgi:hypothetical protein
MTMSFLLKLRRLIMMKLKWVSHYAGVGLGALISSCTKLRDEQFIAAAEAVARMVGEEERGRGALLPPLTHMREVRTRINVGGKRPWMYCCRRGRAASCKE